MATSCLSASHDGQAIRFDENDVRPMGRNATGVRGMNLGEKDYIVGMRHAEARSEGGGERRQVAADVADLYRRKAR